MINYCYFIRYSGNNNRNIYVKPLNFFLDVSMLCVEKKLIKNDLKPQNNQFCVRVSSSGVSRSEEGIGYFKLILRCDMNDGTNFLSDF